MSLRPAVTVAVPAFRNTVAVPPVNDDRPAAGTRPSAEQLARAGKATLLGQLLAGVAHELNNPLLAVLALVDLLAADSTPGSQTQRRVRVVRETALEMRATVRNLVDFAREPGDVSGRFDLVSTVRETLDFARRTSAAGDVEVVESLPGEPVTVVGSRPRLQQALLHLLANARDSVGADGTISVTVGAGGGAVAVTVADSGAGVPPELRDRVFEPFFTTRADRSGLGLSAARAVAELHGGTLELLDGTTFVLTLPVAA